MGPPIYIGGNEVMPGATNARIVSFNGATDLHRWKLSAQPVLGMDAVELQWGHRFTSVETIPSSVFSKDKKMPLQWGHRFTSVETSTPTKKPNPHRGFNGATDLHRWKQEHDRPNPQQREALASMGPPIYIGGNLCSKICIESNRKASMGPPIYIGGNKPEAGSERLSVVGFNGATDLHRWKPLL